MRGDSQAGFTVIEVMLFVAISGLLMAGLLIGTGTAIARQRYKDSVTTFHSNVQQLYEEVASPYNNRVTATSDCGPSAMAGASQCVLLGKLLVLDGRNMTYYDVIGREPSDNRADSSDDALLQRYNPRVVVGGSANVRQAQLEWGANVRLQTSDTVQPISLLVLRSPESGFMYTYSINRDMSIAREGESLSSVITSGNKAARTICIESADVFSGGEEMALRIKRGASSATALEVVSNQKLRDDGGEGAQC